MRTVNVDPDAVWHASGLCDSRDEADERYQEIKRQIEAEGSRRGMTIWWDTYSGGLPCWALAIAKSEVYQGCRCDRGCDRAE